jgi:NAD+ kinase
MTRTRQQAARTSETGQQIHRAVLFVNLHKQGARETAEEIRQELERRLMTISVYAFDGRPEIQPEGTWDIAFSLGGDGTVLYTARTAAAAAIPLFPINLGTLGFIAGVPRRDWITVFNRLLSGEPLISKRCMLALSVQRQGDTVLETTCLNDAVVSSSGIAKLVRLGVQAETAQGQYASLGSYRADGLIAATPTGSTAYSMAAGGPIVDPEMEAVIITPICPFTLSYRPLVLPSRRNIVITLSEQQRSALLLTIDGQDVCTLHPRDRIIVRQAAHHALLVSTDQSSYYAALRDKLAWAAPGAGDTHA